MKRWITKRQAMENFGISEKVLKRMRDNREIEYMPFGSTFRYSEESIDAHFSGHSIKALQPKTAEEERKDYYLKEVSQQGRSANDGNQSKKLQKKEATMNWSKPQPSTGLCRLDCGKHFFIIEHHPKSGNSYQLEYRDAEGKRCYKRMDKERITNRDQAFEEYLRLRIEISEQNANEIDKENITFSAFVPMYLKRLKDRKPRSYDNRKGIIDYRLDVHLGSMKLKDIKHSDLENYVDNRKIEKNRNGNKVKDGTLKQELSVLRHMFSIAGLLGYYSKQNPVKMKEFDLDTSPRDRAFSADEENSILRAIIEKEDQLMKDIVMFDFQTGIRINNICTLKWDKVDLENGKFSVPRQEYKNKSEYVGSLTEPALKILKRIKAGNGHQRFVFVRYENGKAVQLSKSWIGKKFKQYTVEAKVEDAVFHDIRRTTGRRCYSQCGDLLAVRDFLGHKDAQTTLGYLGMDISQDKLRPIVEKLGKIWAENCPFWNGDDDDGLIFGLKNNDEGTSKEATHSC